MDTPIFPHNGSLNLSSNLSVARQFHTYHQEQSGTRSRLAVFYLLKIPIESRLIFGTGFLTVIGITVPSVYGHHNSMGEYAMQDRQDIASEHYT